MERFHSDITKLFVSNLPEGCTPWELRKCLESYGEISGTYVAKKRNKEGCRFGFVSFKNVGDKKELVKVISGARMGENKLKVNIARYAVENSGMARKTEEKSKNSKAAGHSFGGKTFQLRDARSYSNVVGNSSGGDGAFSGHLGKVVEEVREPSKYVVVPDKLVAFNSLFGLSLVGRVVDLETLVDFDRLLRIAKVVVANVQYLGGLSILISFHDAVSASSFLESKVVWGPWFSRLDVWNGQSLPLERVAWLRLIGIPLHLFEPDVMTQVGELFGKVLHVPKMVEEDLDLSVCSVAVLIGEVGRISDVISLRWNRKCYRIGVEEEQQVWIPDCLGAAGINESKASESSPVVDLPCSGSEGSEESPVKVGEGVVGESIGINQEPTKVASFPMHEVREGGGGHDLEVRFPMQTNQESPREVGPVEFNGFKSGSGKECGRPSRRPGVEVRAKKAQYRPRGNAVGSPSDIRPLKRPRNVLEETEQGSEPGFGFGSV
ncbi:putative RNA recognition motif domain, nucleotide-binding alpha-beta plait domain superfamily [Helianthus annuus]|nr:putative RNA recognition motif domain, nucleotide-binding alpha-beta plait domain superfamily [Helianthus annuus]KAJ0628944.1 putative RNA recognition motif domain, nucleotide-binding alpha-beta plait domain superfamily [Helianthus annuus]KAJ0654798.1 putative RNA recognition motif domain, nucleotide-binding alpha-beta plait domain superfamily [Helianthus annuus]KAJ0838690.1 putative RNA recognition motif domain, nucleotide-binding alpha-beta plait domain superfamily [Helianthus annuus]